MNKIIQYSFARWCLDNSHQDWLDRWDCELNKCDPDSITYGTRKRYYFKCPRNIHPSEAISVSNAIRYNHLKCKRCRSFGQWMIDNLGCDAIDRYWSDKNEIDPFDISYGSNSKKVWIKCMNDRHPDYDIVPNNFTRGDRCPICSNHKCVKGINDIATTRPQCVEWFDDIQDSYIYTEYSHHRTLFKCKYCGYRKPMRIADFSSYGFSCPLCGDGISYPNKFMANILRQLDVDFTPEYIIEPQTYQYDFYIRSIDAIVEMHGPQHYEECTLTSRTLEEEMENDKLKLEWARQNNITNYIVIDSRHSDKNFIFNNIMMSKLVDLLNIDCVDANIAELYATSNLLQEVCTLWNDNICRSIKQLAVIFCVCEDTIRNWLKTGTEIGMCKYVPQLKPIVCVQNGYVFKNNSTCANISDTVFEQRLRSSDISEVVCGHRNSVCGYNFQSITLDEYFQIKDIEPHRVFE